MMLLLEFNLELKLLKLITKILSFKSGILQVNRTLDLLLDRIIEVRLVHY
jgi:hypothetical protein